MASAYGANQNGTIDGKLKGPIWTNTPIGSRIEVSSMPAAMSAEKSPICSVGMPAATSMFSRVRISSPRASSRRLAVLDRDRARQVLELLLHQVMQPEQQPSTLHRGRRAPRIECIVSGPHGIRHIVVGRHRRLGNHPARGGVRDLRGIRAARRGPFPRDPVLERLYLRSHVADLLASCLARRYDTGACRA